MRGTTKPKPEDPTGPAPELPLRSELPAPEGPSIAPAEETETVFLTAYDVSKRWKWTVRPRTLANWRGQGKGPRFTRVGSIPLYRLQDVVAYERERAAQGLPH